MLLFRTRNMEYEVRGPRVGLSADGRGLICGGVPFNQPEPGCGCGRGPFGKRPPLWLPERIDVLLEKFNMGFGRLHHSRGEKEGLPHIIHPQ